MYCEKRKKEAFCVVSTSSVNVFRRWESFVAGYRSVGRGFTRSPDQFFALKFMLSCPGREEQEKMTAFFVNVTQQIFKKKCPYSKKIY